MAKFTYYLNRPKEEISPVYLAIVYSGKRLKYFVGISVTTRHWDQKKQRVKPSVIEAEMVNPDLKERKAVAQETFRKMSYEGVELNNNSLREELDRLVKGNLTDEPTTLLSFADQYIEELPKKINPRTGDRISPNTVKIHKQLRARLNEFKASTNKKVDFNAINMAFYNSFIEWLHNRVNTEDEPMYSQNTIGKYINTLKTWLNRATEKGLNKNLEFQKREFKRPREKSEEIYLNLEELKTIAALDLAKDKGLERVRDLFLVACHCGLRYSDFSRLNRDHIEGGSIKMRSQKTGAIVETPISMPVQRVIDKYNGTFPKAVTNQQFNKALKEIGRLAGIDGKVKIHRTRGGLREEREVFKYDLIKTHTARRSFCTNMYNSGLPVASILAISGHATESQLFTYIRTSREESASRVREHIDRLYSGS